MKKIFSYESYKDYISDSLASHGLSKSTLASFINAQSSFISQVLNNDKHLSLEYALKVTTFFKLSEIEQDFFIKLVQRDKTKDESVKAFFSEQLKEIIKAQDDYILALDGEKVEKETFYELSTRWYYPVIHLLVAGNVANTFPEIQKKLKVRDIYIEQALIKFVEKGYFSEAGGVYSINPDKNFLMFEANTEELKDFHHMWRLKGLQQLEKNAEEDLFSTNSVRISLEAADKIKQTLLDAHSKAYQSIQDNGKSKETCGIYTICTDFYRVDEND